MAVTHRQQRLIDAMLTSPHKLAACAAAGVGKSTMNRWEQQPEFQAALAEAQRGLFADGYARLLADQRANLDELARLRDEAENEHVRLRAALGWEQALTRRYELLILANLEQRVEALEQRQS